MVPALPLFVIATCGFFLMLLQVQWHLPKILPFRLTGFFKSKSQFIFFEHIFDQRETPNSFF
jgi:hypothetical protein